MGLFLSRRPRLRFLGAATGVPAVPVLRIAPQASLGRREG